MSLTKDFLRENGLDEKEYYSNPEKYIKSMKDEVLKQKLILYSYSDDYICFEPKFKNNGQSKSKYR